MLVQVNTDISFLVEQMFQRTEKARKIKFGFKTSKQNLTVGQRSKQVKKKTNSKFDSGQPIVDGVSDYSENERP